MHLCVYAGEWNRDTSASMSSSPFCMFVPITPPTPHTLHLTPYTVHSIPYTLHLTPYTPYPTPYTLQPTPHTLHPTP